MAWSSKPPREKKSLPLEQTYSGSEKELVEGTEILDKADKKDPLLGSTAFPSVASDSGSRARRIRDQDTARLLVLSR